MSVGEFNDCGPNAVVLVNSFEEGLLNCELLIVVGGVNR